MPRGGGGAATLCRCNDVMWEPGLEVHRAWCQGPVGRGRGRGGCAEWDEGGRMARSKCGVAGVEHHPSADAVAMVGAGGLIDHAWC